MGYFKQMLNNQVLFSNYEGTYKEYAFSKLIVKALNDSYNTIKSNAPFELTSRYVGAIMTLKNN